MDTTCCSLHLHLLGELEYADESWFNKDGNIRVCLCLPADATEMGHCQDSGENTWRQVCVPRGRSLEFPGCPARCATHPSAKVHSTWVFFFLPLSPRSLKGAEVPGVVLDKSCQYLLQRGQGASQVKIGQPSQSFISTKSTWAAAIRLKYLSSCRQGEQHMHYLCKLVNLSLKKSRLWPPS